MAIIYISLRANYTTLPTKETTTHRVWGTDAKGPLQSNNHVIICEWHLDALDDIACCTLAGISGEGSLRGIDAGMTPVYGFIYQG